MFFSPLFYSFFWVLLPSMTHSSTDIPKPNNKNLNIKFALFMYSFEINYQKVKHISKFDKSKDIGNLTKSLLPYSPQFFKFRHQVIQDLETLENDKRRFGKNEDELFEWYYDVIEHFLIVLKYLKLSILDMNILDFWSFYSKQLRCNFINILENFKMVLVERAYLEINESFIVFDRSINEFVQGITTSDKSTHFESLLNLSHSLTTKNHKNMKILLPKPEIVFNIPRKKSSHFYSLLNDIKNDNIIEIRFLNNNKSETKAKCSKQVSKLGRRYIKEKNKKRIIIYIDRELKVFIKDDSGCFFLQILEIKKDLNSETALFELHRQLAEKMINSPSDHTFKQLDNFSRCFQASNIQFETNFHELLCLKFKNLKTHELSDFLKKNISKIRRYFTVNLVDIFDRYLKSNYPEEIRKYESSFPNDDFVNVSSFFLKKICSFYKVLYLRESTIDSSYKKLVEIQKKILLLKVHSYFDPGVFDSFFGNNLSTPLLVVLTITNNYEDLLRNFYFFWSRQILLTINQNTSAINNMDSKLKESVSMFFTNLGRYYFKTLLYLTSSREEKKNIALIIEMLGFVSDLMISPVLLIYNCNLNNIIELFNNRFSLTLLLKFKRKELAISKFFLNDIDDNSHRLLVQIINLDAIKHKVFPYLECFYAFGIFNHENPFELKKIKNVFFGLFLESKDDFEDFNVKVNAFIKLVEKLNLASECETLINIDSKYLKQLNNIYHLVHTEKGLFLLNHFAISYIPEFKDQIKCLLSVNMEMEIRNVYHDQFAINKAYEYLFIYSRPEIEGFLSKFKSHSESYYKYSEIFHLEKSDKTKFKESLAYKIACLIREQIESEDLLYPVDERCNDFSSDETINDEKLSPGPNSSSSDSIYSSDDDVGDEKI